MRLANQDWDLSLMEGITKVLNIKISLVSRYNFNRAVQSIIYQSATINLVMYY